MFFSMLNSMYIVHVCNMHKMYVFSNKVCMYKHIKISIDKIFVFKSFVLKFIIFTNADADTNVVRLCFIIISNVVML